MVLVMMSSEGDTGSVKPTAVGRSGVIMEGNSNTSKIFVVIYGFKNLTFYPSFPSI